jgi:hypothetical protein
MSGFHNDDELLALLADAFPTQPVKPDEKARQRLRDALANDNLAAFDSPASRGARWRRRIGSRAGVFTLSSIGILVIGGAAAAVTTNTLPGPTRNLAYDIGLPVTSPALYHARQQLGQLVSANAQHHTTTARQLGHDLLRDLTLLNHADLAQIRKPAQIALTQTGLLHQAQKILGIATSTTTTTVAPSSSTSTTTTTTPVLPTVPGLGLNPTSTITSILP